MTYSRDGTLTRGVLQMNPKLTLQPKGKTRNTPFSNWDCHLLFCFLEETHVISSSEIDSL